MCGWESNSGLMFRMLEAKLNKVEEELGKRNQENEALKAVMRDKYEEERRMKENNKQLQEQVLDCDVIIKVLCGS